MYVNNKTFKYTIGIDEVGRGPLAGPVAVGAVVMKGAKVPRHLVPGRDSKQLSAEEREVWFLKIKEAKKRGELDYAVSLVSSKVIDKKGLSFAIRKALAASLDKIDVDPKKCLVLLDGGLKAPSKFSHQKTIIKGDEKEPVIALASIAAKVTRDRLMMGYAKLYKKYGFEQHKGYGTRFHILKIKQLGLCLLHRKSFLKWYTVKNI